MTSGDSRDSALRYIAAFVLGMVCMAAIFAMIVLHGGTFLKSGNTPQPATPSAAEEPAAQSTGPQAGQQKRSNQGGNPVPRIVLAKPRNPRQSISGNQTQADEKIGVGADDRLSEHASNVGIVSPRVPIGVAIVLNTEQGATISGRVFIDGEPPAEKPLPLDASCGKLWPQPPATRFYVRSEDHGLADVFVVISDGLANRSWPVPENSFLIQQKGCVYTPYIGAVQVGQKILVENLDPVLHNVHVVPSASGNAESNHAQMPNGKPLDLVFQQPELFLRFKCDVHPWMFSYVSVVAHPYFAVTDEKGAFRIVGVPTGKYTLEAYHRKAGKLAQPLEVKGNEFTSVQFDFEVPPPGVQTAQVGAAP